MLGTVPKQPADRRDVDVDFSAWIPEDDTILTVEYAVDPAYDHDTEPNGLQIESAQVASPIVKLWASGGVTGTTYKVTVTASTDGGRIKETEFKIRVKDC